MAFPSAMVEKNLKSTALKYNTKAEFRDNDKYAYNKACKLGLLDTICSHMINGNSKWDRASITEAALECTSIKEFRGNNSKAYDAAVYYGILDEVCEHMEPSKRVKWETEEIFTVASKYSTKKEFRKKEPSAYNAARKRGVAEGVMSHMSSEQSTIFTEVHNIKGIYFLYDDDELVYIGKTTYSAANRLSSHMKSTKRFNKVIVYEIPNEADIAIAEICLIIEYNPKYNKDVNIDESPTILIKGIDNIMKNKYTIYIDKEEL